MKTYYSYIRVSTAKQGEGASLDVQKETNKSYARQRGMEISRHFEEMETAAKQGRAVFNEMIRLLKAGEADGVIIHKIDRSARNLKDWAEIANLIDKGIEVHFSHESLDMQARGGRLSADIQAVIAADYIRNLRQEAIKGLYGRLQQGIYPFQAPTGYLNNGKGKPKIVDSKQAPLVRKAFEFYATRKYSLHTLHDKMHSLGLRNIKGNRMGISALSRMLNNPFYIGVIVVKGQNFQGKHEALMSTALFRKVQLVLRNSAGEKKTKHEFKFSKLIKCHHCNYSMIAELQKGHVYYRCHTKDCLTKGIREEKCENLLMKAFQSIQLYPEEMSYFKQELEKAEIGATKHHENILASIKMQKQQVDLKMDRLTDCYLEGGIDKDTYQSRKGKLLIEYKEKEHSESELSKNKSSLYKKTRKFLELANNLIKAYEKGIFEEKRELLHQITSNLHVSGKKLRIAMRLPFCDLAERYGFDFGEHSRNDPRIMYEGIAKSDNSIPYGTLIFSDENTSPIMGKPLSKEKLKLLLDHLLTVIAELPEDSLKNDYDL